MKAAIDTNILVRLVTKDDVGQFRKVSQFLKKYGSDDIFVSASALLELGFVLKSFYKWPKEEVLKAIELIMNADQFHIDQEATLRQAVVKCRKGFTMYDAFIGEVGAARNLKTYTLDKNLKSNASFIVI